MFMIIQGGKQDINQLNLDTGRVLICFNDLCYNRKFNNHILLKFNLKDRARQPHTCQKITSVAISEHEAYYMYTSNSLRHYT